MDRDTPPPLQPLGPRGYDEKTPNASRMYDYYLGGNASFEADRELADSALEVLPCTRELARLNRSWLRRVVESCLDEGIDQFLDLGSGIPTVGNVHEIVHARNPEARVVYVDYDATAVSHAQGLLLDNPNATILHADIRDPDSVLRDPATELLLDFSRPVGLLMVGILLYVPPEYDPAGLVASYRDACAPGSLLPMSVITLDEVAQYDLVTHRQMLDLIEVYREASEQLTMVSYTQFASWFAGMELVAPGITLLPDWRPDPGVSDVDASTPARRLGIGGMGRVRYGVR